MRGPTRRAMLQGSAALLAAGCGRDDDLVESFSRGPSDLSSLPANAAAADAPSAAGAQRFTLKYAPHFGQFDQLAGPEYLDQLAFAADQGFRAWEDNIVNYRPVDQQEAIAAEMARLGMQMGVFVAADSARQPDLLLTEGDEDALAFFLDSVTQSVDVARRMNAKWMTVLTGYRHPTLNDEVQKANLIDALRRACDIVEPHDLVLVLEPVNSRIDFPDLFLDNVADGYLICRAIDRPSCKLLFDIYHKQVTSGNIINDLEATWDQVAYIQVADHPGRNEPTTGEINYINVFQFLHEHGYEGIIGAEHGVSGDGAQGERDMIEAYRYCDSFIGAPV